ncbi:SinI family restriction endonuclease [Yersinia enterocolitica]|uniref:SinI family restriction endonuclease n=2 Tax=Yersinia TaxID=629 RepID=UPI0032FE67AD|nr:SinI family restriction endonuclease [Yersinia enterocolitica]EKN4860684.1 SinI family restriction endonuclease [Yersinia enterocolitica]HDL7658697.1 SinI family restriction endonuclease [Yersinia enterocolitica]HDL7662580.1 SinI family restriction endonuclease [Yersinia enterocolitica]HDL7725449.1 SinI family restriction endonuclease [Yersinia enterocolitica]
MSDVKFIDDFEDIARDAMNEIDKKLTEKFVTLIKFLSDNHDACAKLKGKNAPRIGSKDFIIKIAGLFAESRHPKKPAKPATVPDEMVGVVLHVFFDFNKDDLPRIQKEHSFSMGAENIIGDLLERYLSHKLEPHGWIWCSGTIVKAVDFIKLNEKDNSWTLLQVKNRDNTENSSSSAIRHGTKIIKWFRTFSKKKGSNWDAFPDEVSTQHLSEEGFKDFVVEYLSALK